MFSDRLWVLKAAAVVGLLALLFNDTRRTLALRHPDLERIPLHWSTLRDHTFHVAAKQVRAADATGFEIGTRVGPMRVLIPTPPPAGTYVTANVRAIGPRTLKAVDLQVLSGYAWKRPLNYAISILTVIVYFWLVRRRFRWKPEAGVFRSKY